MRKPGDILMIFSDPIKLEHPTGQARLIKFIRDYHSMFEEWLVEYLDQEEMFYKVLIRKEEVDGKDKD